MSMQTLTWDVDAAAAVAGNSDAYSLALATQARQTLDELCFFIKFFIRMLKNNAQIAPESIKIILELPGPLSGPWTPAESEFGSALVMCVLAQNLLRPP